MICYYHLIYRPHRFLSVISILTFIGPGSISSVSSLLQSGIVINLHSLLFPWHFFSLDIFKEHPLVFKEASYSGGCLSVVWLIFPHDEIQFTLFGRNTTDMCPSQCFISGGTRCWLVPFNDANFYHLVQDGICQAAPV